jgi:hypothetical protein
MGSTEDQRDAGAKPGRCTGSTLAGHEAIFAHWHFCELPEGHEGPHRCMSCHIEFGPTKPARWTAPTEDETPPTKIP